MKLLSKYIDQTSLKQYDNLYVLPVFDYGCVVWGNTTHANVTRLVKLQKRAARIILKADFLTPSEQLFKKLNWLTFPKRVQYHTCLMVYKGINGSAPEYISSMFRKNMRDKPGQQLCIFQELTHPSLTGHFQFKDRNYGIVYPLTLEKALLSIDSKAH